MITCPNCGTSNRATARFCLRCGQPLAPQPVPSASLRTGAPLPMLPPRGTLASWLTQVQQTVALAWQQGVAEIRAFYDEWIARHPVVTGTVIAPPQQTQVTIVVQGLFGPVPFSGGQSQQNGLLLQVQDARAASPVSVVLIGATQGALPQHGDDVYVWGQWDAGMNAYRAWRVQIAQRGGQPTGLELTTGRPMPLALLSLLLLALVLLACVCSLCARAVF